MRATLRRDLTAAVKARDAVAVAALRSALAAIANAEAQPATDQVPPGSGTSSHIAGATDGVGATDVQRRNLTDAEVRAIIEAEVRDRALAAEDYERLGRQDRAARLRAEADHLLRYLPPGT